MRSGFATRDGMTEENHGELTGRDAKGRFAPGNPFAPKVGEPSRNPGGRPKKKWLTEVAEELLEEKLSDPAERARYKAALWEKLLSSRMVSAITTERVWERTEGKLTQPVEVSGEIDIMTIIEEGRKRAEGGS